MCECPKNCRVLFVCRMAVGHADFVDLWYIVCADGLLVGNFGSDCRDVGRRKFLVIGPQCP